MRRGLGVVYRGWSLALMCFALVCAAMMLLCTETVARAKTSSAGEAQAPQSRQGTATQRTTATQPAPPQSASSQQSTQSSSSQSSPPPAAMHFITVTFDYDFSKTPACGAKKPVHPCVSQFSIFETTNGTSRKHRVFLFSVQLPAQHQRKQTITQKSPQQIALVIGWHKLGVAAIDPVTGESTLQFCESCATWINVQSEPTLTPSAPAPGSSVTPPGVTAPSTPSTTPSPAPTAH